MLVLGLLYVVFALGENMAPLGAEELRGTWVLVHAEQDGKPVPAEQIRGVRIIYEGDQWWVKKSDTTLQRGTLKVNPAMKPKTIDSTFADGPVKGMTLLGIYKFDGDTLTMCGTSSPMKDRPKEFATSPGSGLRLSILKRDKP